MRRSSSALHSCESSKSPRNTPEYKAWWQTSGRHRYETCTVLTENCCKNRRVQRAFVAITMAFSYNKNTRTWQRDLTRLCDVSFPVTLCLQPVLFFVPFQSVTDLETPPRDWRIVCVHIGYEKLSLKNCIIYDTRQWNWLNVVVISYLILFSFFCKYIFITTIHIIV